MTFANADLKCDYRYFNCTVKIKQIEANDCKKTLFTKSIL